MEALDPGCFTASAYFALVILLPFCMDYEAMGYGWVGASQIMRRTTGVLRGHEMSGCPELALL